MRTRRFWILCALSHRPATILIVGGAATLVALGISVGYVLDASSAQTDADRFRDETIRTGDPSLAATQSQCAPPTGTSVPAACGPLGESLDHRDQSHRIANGAFWAAGIIAVGTVATYFLWPTSPAKYERTGVRVAPWIGRDTGGAAVVAQF